MPIGCRIWFVRLYSRCARIVNQRDGVYAPFAFLDG
jgi:hypothetical protein